MALITTVSKEKVTQISETEFNVSITVGIEDSGESIFNKTYSKRYTQGQTLDSVKSVLLKKVQADWDKLTAEQTIYNLGAFGTLCSEMETTINGYINP